MPCLENYCMLGFFGLEKSCKDFLRDWISVQTGMRQVRGSHPNTKVILGEIVQTSCVFKKGRANLMWLELLWNLLIIFEGFAIRSSFFPVMLICSFERNFSGYKWSALSIRIKVGSRFIIKPGCPERPAPGVEIRAFTSALDMWCCSPKPMPHCGADNRANQ